MRSPAITSLWLASISLLAGCGNLFSPCNCPAIAAAHPQGQLTSRQGGRAMTIDGTMIEVRELDGTITRYRIKSSMSGYGTGMFCGPRPTGWGLRTIALASSSATTTVLSVRAEEGTRFTAHAETVASGGTGHLRTTTAREPDGSLIEVEIDLTSAPAASRIDLELRWTLEKDGGEEIDEIVEARLERQAVCDNNGQCTPTGPAQLGYDAACW